jgi:hypothetical protein
LSTACTAGERLSAKTLAPATTPPTAKTPQPDKNEVNKIAANNRMVIVFRIDKLSKNCSGLLIE